MKYRFEVQEANMRDLTYILANLRKADWEELQPQLPMGTPKTEAANYVISAITPGFAYTVSQNDKPIAAFGFSPGGLQQSLYIGWAFGTNKFNRAAPVIASFGLNVIAPELVRIGALRIEVRAHIAHTSANNWLKRLGFHEEAVLKYYGGGGETYKQYSATIDDYYRYFPPTGVKN